MIIQTAPSDAARLAGGAQFAPAALEALRARCEREDLPW